MKIALTIPSAGAGKWCWTSWMNAFNTLGHEAFDINQCVDFNLALKGVDLLICTTSQPRQEFITWRDKNPDKKVALNVLAWSDLNIGGLSNDGVQASVGNREYASKIKPSVIFAQYGIKWRKLLLKNWIDSGYQDSSMMMAADSTIYQNCIDYNQYKYDFSFSGGFWFYKSQIIVPWLLPIIQKYRQNSILIGKGWPIGTDSDRSEREIGSIFKLSKVCPNVHEPHSHFGYDIVERCMKVPYCGGLLVSDYVEEMVDEGFKNGENCFLCKSPKEYQEIIDEVIANPGKYEQIRKNGQEFITNQHTYIHRVQNLLKDIYG